MQTYTLSKCKYVTITTTWLKAFIDLILLGGVLNFVICKYCFLRQVNFLSFGSIGVSIFYNHLQPVTARLMELNQLSFLKHCLLVP